MSLTHDLERIVAHGQPRPAAIAATLLRLVPLLPRYGAAAARVALLDTGVLTLTWPGHRVVTMLERRVPAKPEFGPTPAPYMAVVFVPALERPGPGGLTVYTTGMRAERPWD